MKYLPIAILFLAAACHDDKQPPTPTPTSVTQSEVTGSSSTAEPLPTMTAVLPPTLPPASTLEPTAQIVIQPTQAPTIAFVPTLAATETPLPLPTATASPTAIAAVDLYKLHNAERAAAGLQHMVPNSLLTAIAEYRAIDMATKNYFSHAAPAGDTFDVLAREFGVRYSLLGENICVIHGVGGDYSQLAHTLFMNSPGHRDNIMDPRFDSVGIGWASGNGKSYCAVIFGKLSR